MAFLLCSSPILFFLAVHVAIARAQPAPVGDWTEQDTSEDLRTAFGTQSYSWDVGDNWRKCMNFEIELPTTLIVSDYGELISKGLDFLHHAGGGSLVLGEGEFVVKSEIKLPSNVCLRGKGMNKTVLQVLPDAISDYPSNGALRSLYSTYLTVHDLTLDGGIVVQDYSRNPRVAKYGVDFKLVNFAWLKGVSVRRFAGTGIAVRGELDRWMYHVALEGCESSGHGLDGYRLSQTHYASLVKCKAARNGRHGVSIGAGAAETLLKSNSIVDIGLLSGHGCGVSIRESGGLTPRAVFAMQNNITRAAHAGVCIDGAREVAFDRTRIVNMRDRAAFCFDVPRATFLETNGMCRVRSKTAYKLRPIPGIEQSCPARGIRAGNFCCRRSCRKCGGRGCAKRGPLKTCCLSTIKRLNRICGKGVDPPCELE